MISRACRTQPGHDGVRLFLPAFGCSRYWRGLGPDASRPLGRLGQGGHRRSACVEGVVSIAVMMPVPLSYFSPLVGGLPGATRAWDGTDVLLGRTQPRRASGLAENTQPGRKLTRSEGSDLVAILGGRAICRGDSPSVDGDSPKWVVLQNRPGAFSPVAIAPCRAKAVRRTPSTSSAYR